MDKIFNKKKVHYVALLLSTIIIAEIIIHIAHLPGWPMFCCMVLFTLGQKEKKIIKDIIIGSLFGILSALLLNSIIFALEPSLENSELGVFLIKVVFVCIFVSCILV